MDQFLLNKTNSIIFFAGAGDISNQIRFFMTLENKNLVTNFSSAKYSWLKSVAKLVIFIKFKIKMI